MIIIDITRKAIEQELLNYEKQNNVEMKKLKREEKSEIFRTVSQQAKNAITEKIETYEQPTALTVRKVWSDLYLWK